MSKSTQSFKQFSLIRRVLVSHCSGSIHYRFGSSGSSEQITVTTKQLSGCDIEQQVKKLLQFPTYKCEWNSQLRSTSEMNACDIIPCICSAMNDVKWLPNHALALKKSFFKMSAVRVRLPNHTITYSDMGAFMALYHFSQDNVQSSPACFLKTVDKDNQIRYLKVLILTYCLGLMSTKV